MLKKLVLVFALIALIALLGCTQEQTSQAASTTQKPGQATDGKEANEHLLVFFINPDGGPCKMQSKILSEMAGELEGKVVIRPVQTNVKADLEIFYTYGIRALPTLILADGNGKEIKRLPPGVHSADTVRNLVSQITVH